MNISLLPGRTCNGAPCYKDCYARKFMFRPTVNEAWTENTAYYFADPLGFFGDIISAIEKDRPCFFRWHVAGDIPDQQYLNFVIRIAKRFPDIAFLIFTKRYELSYAGIPDNLSIVFSAWPGYKKPPRKASIAGIAWMNDGTESRVPIDALNCPGSCETCGMCWELKKTGRDVVFHKH